MKTTITLELLKRVHKEVSLELKKEIELEVPEVKPMLEANRWITTDDLANKKWLCYVNSDGMFYGFDAHGEWIENVGKYNPLIDPKNRYARHEEVETAIKNECIRLGLTKGKTICLNTKQESEIKSNGNFCFSLWGNYMCFGGVMVFNNGKFATPITEPTEKELLIEKLNELKEKATELENQINQMKCETK